jgi:hypothetical protein
MSACTAIYIRVIMLSVTYTPIALIVVSPPLLLIPGYIARSTTGRLGSTVSISTSLILTCSVTRRFSSTVNIRAILILIGSTIRLFNSTVNIRASLILICSTARRFSSIVIIILRVSFCNDIWYCNILAYYLDK